MDVKIENGCLIVKCDNAQEAAEFRELVKGCRIKSGAATDAEALVAATGRYWLNSETDLTIQ